MLYNVYSNILVNVSINFIEIICYYDYNNDDDDHHDDDGDYD